MNICIPSTSNCSFFLQTEEQYTFILDALAETVAAGETCVGRSYLSRYVSSLETTYTTDENAIPWQLIDRQFKLLTAFCPVDGQYQVGPPRFERETPLIFT